MSANDRQVGGDHYKVKDGEQHWDRIYRLFGPGYLIGCATKYIERYQKKGGEQDLEKAMHYIEKLKELEYGSAPPAAAPYDFLTAVVAFNEMYGLGAQQRPVNLGPERVEQFLRAIKDEVSEGDELLEKMQEASEMTTMVEMADWLGDLIVYATSELMRWGLPVNRVLQIIMESNFSKLGANGKPMLKDGKVVKGPNYYKPEPMLAKLLFDLGVPLDLPQPPLEQEIGFREPPIPLAPEESNRYWQNEGFYGDGTSLWKCRACRTLGRLAGRPANAHGCGGHPQPIPGALKG